MKVEVQIDENIKETKLIIYTDKITSEISDIIEKLSNKTNVIGFIDEQTYIIKENDIEAVYSENGKVYIKTVENIYQSKKRLYEMEEILSKNKFIRISNSEIINFDKVKNLNSKFIGTIAINFISGYSTYVSRRYIPKIKDFLNKI